MVWVRNGFHIFKNNYMLYLPIICTNWMRCNSKQQQKQKEKSVLHIGFSWICSPLSLLLLHFVSQWRLCFYEFSVLHISVEFRDAKYWLIGSSFSNCYLDKLFYAILFFDIWRPLEVQTVAVETVHRPISQVSDVVLFSFFEFLMSSQ